MAIPPRRWVGYALLTAGSLLLFDTYTFLRTSWSPLRVPMDASDEIALGYLVAIAGIALLVAPHFLQSVENFAPDSSVKLAAGIADQSVEWRRQQRLPLRKKFSTSPNRGLVGGAAILLVMVPAFLMVIQEEPKQGIYVHLTPQRGRSVDESCLAGPIVISIRGSRTSSEIFLNGTAVPRDDLAKSLKTQLKARAYWEVFVEGDDSLIFSDPIDAMAVIRDLGAQPVIVTPKLRKQLAGECGWKNPIDPSS
ncbi:MAG TPA: hypothetical protein VE377_07695 [Candidatus Dormibacteraeota bacterium]|nr:hypothetical protein [Candidatus Dormibacteraeota bacterium]